MRLIGIQWCSTVLRRELTVGEFIFVVYNLSVTLSVSDQRKTRFTDSLHQKYWIFYRSSKEKRYSYQKETDEKEASMMMRDNEANKTIASWCKEDQEKNLMNN